MSLDKSSGGGSLAASSLTANFQTIYNAEGLVKKLIVAYTGDAAYRLSLGNDSAPLTLAAGAGIVLDFGASKGDFSGAIRARHDGAAPTSGTLSVLAFY